MVMRVCWHHCIVLTKGSRYTFSQHLPFQSVNSNIRIGCERCSRLIKKTPARWKSIVVVHVRFEQTLHLVWELLWPFFEKRRNVQCGIGSISMLIFSHIYNAANRVIAKNRWQSYFKKFQVIFLENNRVQ